MTITPEIKLDLAFALDTLEELVKGRLQALANRVMFTSLDLDMAAWPGFLLSHLPVRQINLEEAVILTLALAPHIRPHLFDRAIQEVYPRGGDFPQLGGLRRKHHRGFIPTGETVLFLLAGEDLQERFRVQQMFSPDHWFAQKRILRLAEVEQDEPPLSGQLVLDREMVEKITLGKVAKPTFSREFPASLITTQLEWEDLVLPHQTQNQIRQILIWLEHAATLMGEMGMSRILKPGYRALFHGPPGTGKTLTASLLAKSTQRDIYRVDLSTVVSKYIGETEKNLANLFNRAENKNWILFFDEADALFSRRTLVQNAHDRYANQEVAYLLQRIEDFSGLVILASNLKSNIDEAFIRRFQSIIHFPFPQSQERLQLWKNAFPGKMNLESDVNLRKLAQQFELTGADIVNVVHFACLNTLAQNNEYITLKTIENGIKREYDKAGKGF